jgi:hypothetical protein
MTTIINGSSPSITFSDGSAQTSATRPFLNRIINGAMVIDQRNAGASVTPTNSQYTLDRYQFYVSQASKLTCQQNAGSVTPPVGFSKYLGVTSSSAYSIGAGDYFTVQQYIEGYNVADLNWGTANAKTITLSFWVRSSLTGTFGGALQNNANNRSYPFTYTINAANTWEYETITIAGDTSGTWETTNSIGLAVYFGLGVGSTYSGTAGAWASANYTSATGATSVVGTNGATFYLTGVQLEVGSTATSFDYRPYGTELALCQRYFYLHASGNAKAIGHGSQFNAGNGQISVFFKQPMRTTPTMSVTSGSNYYITYYNGTSSTTSAPDLNAPTTENMANVTTNTSGNAGNAIDFRTNNASAFVAFQAEL